MSGQSEARSPAPGLAGPSGDAIFRHVVDDVRDYAILLLTPEGHIASWNAGAQRLYGYTAEEVMGRHFSLFYQQEAIERGWPLERLRRAHGDGRIEDEGWRVRKDGTRFWADAVMTAVRDEQGGIIGFSEISRDLTARHDKESRLRESERSLRLLIEGVQDYAIFRLSKDGHVISWNKGAERIKGYKADDILGRHFSVFYPLEKVESGWPEEELRRACEQGRFEDEGWRVRKDGSLFWANVVITAIRDEERELIGFSKVTRDLTERRRNEQRLKDSEESLRLVVESVRDHALFLLAPDGTVRSWNSGAERVLGYPAAAIVGQPVSLMYTDEDRASGKPLAELVSARHVGHFSTDDWRVKSDGTKLWANVALTALHNQDGSLRGFAQIVHDLSERRRMEELESEGKRVQQFIAMLSHELRNPLAPISNAVRILKTTSDKAEIEWCADLIGRQTGHLTRLVDDLLDISRISSGKIQIQAAAVELNTLVQLACDGARAGIERLGHTLELRLAPQPVFIHGDATRLTQVITNLLANAAKYTPNGGFIKVSVERDRSAAIVQVSDNGIGMTESLMQHAFEPFVQGTRSLDRPGGGLGIGLALVKSVVELHRGTIVVASAGPGKGTTFTVTLPLLVATPAHSTAPPAAQAVAGEQGEQRRILVVDDNKDAAESLAQLLRRAGHEVLVAHDGLEALHVARTHALDVVLLDIGLPGMNGYDVARELQQLPGVNPRIVAVTGYGQEAEVRAAAEAGFSAHLVKPVDVDELARLIA